jgi:hypothetical protein
MPQIWLTYDELADVMDCDPADARDNAIAIGLDRRKCHDGQTRAKLNALLTEAFLDGLLRRWLEREVQTCASDLHAIREHFAERSAAKLRSALSA